MLVVLSNFEMKPGYGFAFWYNVHIYAGLYASTLMFVIGFTALEFQHHFFDNKNKTTELSEIYIPLSTELDAKSIAEKIRNTLEEVGDIPERQIKESASKDTIDFKIIRPWKKIDIIYYRATGLAKIDKHRTGLGSLLAGLHEGTLREPNSWILNLYSSYAISALLAALLAASLGVYFWFKKSIKHRWQWILIYSSIFCSISVLLWLCFQG